MNQVVLLILACYVLCVVQCAAQSPKPCDTSGVQHKYCVPVSECEQQDLFDLRANVCEEKGLQCCHKKSPTLRIEFTECDSGRGYCVDSSLCAVRTYRMRSNRCPSFEEVCCPKLSVVDQFPSTTTEASTTAEPSTERTIEEEEREPSTEKSGSENDANINGDKPTSNDFSRENVMSTEATDIATNSSVTQNPGLMALDNVNNVDDKSIKETTRSPETISSTFATTTTTAAPATIATTSAPTRKSSRTTTTIKYKEMFTPPPTTTIMPDELRDFKPNLKPEFANGAFTFRECGQRNRHGVVESTIQGESQADYGEYPWMAALFQVNRYNGEKRYCCNGALVESYAVVTTAQCFSLCGSNPANMVVRLGEWIMNSTVEPIPHEDINVEKMIKHPDYQHTSLMNNIAVVVLDGSVEYKPTIQPICLPSSEEQLGSMENLVVTGWGTTVEETIAGTKTLSKILKRMDLNTAPDNNCEKVIQENRPFKLHESFACTSTEYRERPCAGDAGAPVAVEKRPNNDQFYLYGLVSWGFTCASEKRKQTVVTKVEGFTDWIEEIFKKS